MATIQKRRNTHRVQIRRKGHPTQTKSFTNKADAKRWASVMEGHIDSEVSQEPLHEPGRPVLQPSSLTTLSEALKRYLREITPMKQGAKQERNRIRAWQRSPLAHGDLATITTADLAQWRNEQEASGIAPATKLLDSERVTGEHGRDVDFLAVHADAPAGGDQDVTVVEGVRQLGQALIGPRRAAVDLGGALHVERSKPSSGIGRALGVELADEAIRGRQVYLWRAAFHLMRKLLKKQGMAPGTSVTDRLGACAAAVREFGLSSRHVRGKQKYSRAESSHVPIRRRERKMQGFRSAGSAQRLLAIHAAVANTFTTCAA
jgi:GNAT superfamily N-acetyltransferase